MYGDCVTILIRCGLKLLKERNFPDTSIFHATKMKNRTLAWQSIYGEISFFQKNSFWLLGDGKKVLTWKDNWIVGKQDPPTSIADFELAVTYSTVSDLIDADTKVWKATIVHQLFSADDAVKILSMRIPAYSTDRLIWTLTRNGQFTVKSAYKKMVDIKTNAADMHDANMTLLWKQLWNLDTLPRVKTFLWKCMNDMIPSSERMGRVMQYSGDMCSMCNQIVETTKHIIWECPFARAVWMSIPGARRSMDVVYTTVYDWITSWFTNDFIKLDADWIIKMANAC